MGTLGLKPSGRLGLSPRRRRPSTPPFTPDQIADLALWYKAGDPQNTVSGGAIEQAFDLSGNGRHATQSTSAARPLDATDPDGRAVMRFDGGDDSLQVLAPPDLANGVTVFLAYRIRQHVNGAGIIGAGKSGDAQGNDKWFEFTSSFSANRTQLVAKDTLANPIVLPARVDPRGDKNYAIFSVSNTTGTLRDFPGSVSDTGTDQVMPGTPDLIALGSRIFNQFASPPFSFVDVYEVGLYARVLGGPEIDQLAAYVQARHGIGWSPGYLDSGLAWWHDDWSSFTLSGSLVDQWGDRSGKGRPWTGSGSARPAKTTDAGKVVVRFDGSDDVLSLGGTLPGLQPFTAAVVYRVRNRVDFEGVLSAAAASGVDHESFWTFETASAASGDMQLFGRSLEADQLTLTRADGGGAQIAIWTAATGNATLRDRIGEVSDSYGGSFGTPAAIVLGARYDAGPFNHGDVDVMATVGVNSALAAVDQQKLIDWAIAKWGV
ncbi:MAG: hypothetical protein ACREJ5_07700 [Geminicoccaceae bacterium]